MINSRITLKRLRELVKYDRASGILRWRVDRGRVRKGDRVGCRDRHGYWITKIDGRMYRVHRLVWFCVKGAWPAGEIDHRDCNPNNNRISNLRVCTRSQNMANRKRPPANTSGYKGVSWDKKNKRWQVHIKAQGRQYHLGRYVSLGDAVKAYDAAAIKYFKDFANLNRRGT